MPKTYAFPLVPSIPIPSGARRVRADVEPELYPFTIDVFLAEVSDADAAAIVCTSTCSVGEEEYPLVPCAPAEVKLVASERSCEEEKRAFDAFPMRHTAALALLRECSGYFGVRELTLCPFGSSRCAPHPVRASDAVDILIFASPVRSGKKQLLKNICGLSLSSVGGGLPSLLAPCPLRGGVLCSGEHAIAQYIDNTIYMLFHPDSLGENDGAQFEVCFRQVLLEALALWAEQGDERKPTSLLPITEENAVVELAKTEASIRAERSDLIERYEYKVRCLEEELFEARRELYELRYRQARPSFLNNRLGTNEPSAFYLELSRAITHPLVESATLVSGEGIYVETRPVFIPHEGARYDIGRFGVLVRYDSKIDVWSLGSTHPGGEPHPHIGRTSGLCLGNVTDAIDRALAEYRYGDAIAYFLSWLEGGYTSENAPFHKVEEWPVAAELVEVR